MLIRSCKSWLADSSPGHEEHPDVAAIDLTIVVEVVWTRRIRQTGAPGHEEQAQILSIHQAVSIDISLTTDVLTGIRNPIAIQILLVADRML